MQMLETMGDISSKPPRFPCVLHFFILKQVQNPRLLLLLDFGRLLVGNFVEYHSWLRILQRLYHESYWMAHSIGMSISLFV